jgi:hypothetical protein
MAEDISTAIHSIFRRREFSSSLSSLYERKEYNINKKTVISTDI